MIYLTKTREFVLQPVFQATFIQLRLPLNRDLKFSKNL